MTNDISGGKLAIMKCTDCRDGYLIVKSGGKGGHFLGCSNYKRDRTGCGRTLSMKDYYKKMGYEWTEDLNEKSTDPASFGRGQGTVENNWPAEKKEPKPAAVKDTARDGGRQKNWEQEMLDQAAPNVHPEERYPEYKGHNVYQIAETALQALVGVLCGSNTEQIRKNHLNAVAEYNALRFLSREEVTEVICWLIDKKYILQTKGRYPVLHITNRGLTYREHFTPRNMKSLAERLNAGAGAEE